ncbi:MAG: hypothetical protein V7647_4148 [Acidobacteriota bacterium]|jgi:hypothetical protein
MTMNRLMERLIAGTAFSLLCLAPAHAQEARGQSESTEVGSFETLSDKVKPGQTVYALDTEGRETEGRLVRLSNTALTLRVAGADRDFPRSELTRLARRGDSVGNGAAIGMGIFAAWGLVGVLNSSGGYSYIDEFGPGAGAAVVGGMAGIGAGIGALIDYAIKGRTVVYRTQPPRVSASPVLLHGDRGIRLAVRF